MIVPSWPWERFADIAEFKNGLNFLDSDSGYEVRMVGVGDFEGSEVLTETESLRRVSINVPLRAEDYLRPLDLLFVRSNGSKSLVGRCLVYEGKVRSATFSGFTIRARVRTGLADPSYVAQVARSPLFREHLRRLGGGSSINNLGQAALGEFKFPLPPLWEQRAISRILRAWDDAVEISGRLRQTLVARRTALGNQFVAPAHPLRRRLGEMTRPLTKRNASGAVGRDSVMGVSNKAGLVPMRPQTIAADISRYHVLQPRAFAYNPMRINVGSIAMSRYESDVLVSPDYVLFACDPAVLIPEYLAHVLTTDWWLHYVNAGASGSVRTRTYYDDLASIAIHTPGIEEQSRIARALSAMDDEIALIDGEIELLRIQKRGLMQKFLTGEVRVGTDDQGAEEPRHD